MKISNNPELVNSHIKKARHNLEFFKLNKEYSKFNDWLIVTLYYSLYHSALALITNKNYSSKNHYATIIVLIKEYRHSKSEFWHSWSGQDGSNKYFLNKIKRPNINIGAKNLSV